MIVEFVYSPVRIRSICISYKHRNQGQLVCAMVNNGEKWDWSSMFTVVLVHVLWIPFVILGWPHQCLWRLHTVSQFHKPQLVDDQFGPLPYPIYRCFSWSVIVMGFWMVLMGFELDQLKWGLFTMENSELLGKKLVEMMRGASHFWKSTHITGRYREFSHEQWRNWGVGEKFQGSWLSDIGCYREQFVSWWLNSWELIDKCGKQVALRRHAGAFEADGLGCKKST